MYNVAIHCLLQSPSLRVFYFPEICLLCCPNFEFLSDPPLIVLSRTTASTDVLTPVIGRATKEGLLTLADRYW
jgi:hypothetical protein